MAINKNLLGAAGEHLVLSRLLAKELLATMAPGGYEKTDIFVQLPKDQTIKIQVKTSVTGAKGGWVMSEKYESLKDRDLYFCLVDMSKLNPQVYVLPARVVARVVRDAHVAYLALPKKSGGTHKDTARRELKNFYTFDVPGAPHGWLDRYLEDWDQILGK